MFCNNTKIFLYIFSCFVACGITTTSFADTKKKAISSLSTKKKKTTVLHTTKKKENSLPTTTKSSASLQEIETLLAQKQYQNAYLLAQELSPQMIGEPVFDSLLGQSAWAVKKYDVAVLAFDRVAMNNPGNKNARLNLAKSYYELKMYDRAKSEVQALTPGTYPAFLSGEVQALTIKIDKSLEPKKSSYLFYGGTSYGYDDNVAGSTDEDFGRFPDLTGKSDAYYKANQVAALENLRDELRGKYNKKYKSDYILPRIGIRGAYATTEKLGIYWDINGSHREYISTNDYNTSQANLSTGISYRFNPNYLMNMDFYYQEYLLDGKRYRETPMGSLSFGRFLNSHNLLKIYTDIGILSYPNDRSLSVNMYKGGLEWTYFDSYRNLIMEVYYGRNNPKGCAAKSSGSDYYGVDISAKHQIIKDIDLVASFSYQNSLYDVKKYSNTGRRRDPFFQYTGGLYYRFHPNYTWYVLTSFTDNRSNIFTYSYDRLETVTGINFMF